MYKVMQYFVHGWLYLSGLLLLRQIVLITIFGDTLRKREGMARAKRWGIQFLVVFGGGAVIGMIISIIYNNIYYGDPVGTQIIEALESIDD